MAQDRHDFEESYMSLGGIHPNNKLSGDGSSSKESKINQKVDVASTSIQVHEASLMGFDRMLSDTMGATFKGKQTKAPHSNTA